VERIIGLKALLLYGTACHRKIFVFLVVTFYDLILIRILERLSYSGSCLKVKCI